MADKFCKSCRFWLEAYKGLDGKFGTCDHPLVEGKVVVDKEREEEEVIHTNEWFGCIYHTPLHQNVVTALPAQPKKR